MSRDAGVARTDDAQRARILEDAHAGVPARRRRAVRARAVGRAVLDDHELQVGERLPSTLAIASPRNGSPL